MNAINIRTSDRLVEIFRSEDAAGDDRLTLSDGDLYWWHLMIFLEDSANWKIITGHLLPFPSPWEMPLWSIV